MQELTRLLEREDLLWCRATKVAQQSLSERFLEFPASVFERVFKDLSSRTKENDTVLSFVEAGMQCYQAEKKQNKCIIRSCSYLKVFSLVFEFILR